MTYTATLINHGEETAPEALNAKTIEGAKTLASKKFSGGWIGQINIYKDGKIIAKKYNGLSRWWVDGETITMNGREMAA